MKRWLFRIAVVAAIAAGGAWLGSRGRPDERVALEPRSRSTATEPSSAPSEPREPLAPPQRVEKASPSASPGALPATRALVPSSSASAEPAKPVARPKVRVLARLDGGPCTYFGARVVEHESGSKLAELPVVDRPSARATLELPTARFHVDVLADGCEPLVLGPFDPGRVPDPLVASLVSAPGISGRIALDGATIDGAFVTLHEVYSARRGASLGGEPVTRGPVVASAQSLRGGRYWLTHRDAGSFVVRVARDVDEQALEFGPFELDGRRALRDVDLSLFAHGSLRGTVVDVSGARASKVLVRISRGDANPLWATSNDRGEFFVAGLAPGSYWVRARTQEHARACEFDDQWPATPRSPTLRFDGERAGKLPRFDVEVFAGTESIHEAVLDASMRLEIVVEGGLKGLTQQWTVRSASSTGVTGYSLQRDGDSTWLADLPVGGRAEVRGVVITSISDATFEFAVDLAPGTKTIRIAPPVGVVEVTPVLPVPRTCQIQIRGKTPQGESFTWRTVLERGVPCSFPWIPVGTHVIARSDAPRDEVPIVVEEGRTTKIELAAAH